MDDDTPRSVPCPKCLGTGVVRKMLFGKEACPACFGDGTVLASAATRGGTKAPAGGNYMTALRMTKDLEARAAMAVKEKAAQDAAAKREATSSRKALRERTTR